MTDPLEPADAPNRPRAYFFCGIGGSGMLPLAMILKARGHGVSGSDRALDQGRTPQKFDDLRARGIALFPQDGSGITHAGQTVIASAAIEDTVPDMAATHRVGARRVTRAEALAEIFNAADCSIGIAGTSGKSTTTAMIAWILHATGRAPTVMNGAVMKNFRSKANPFASSVMGDDAVFVSEIDESDGSIALFTPTISVLNNVAEDHKSMEELRVLFGDFIAKAGTAIVNADNTEARALARDRAAGHSRFFSLGSEPADLTARAIEPQRFGVCFEADDGSARHQVTLAMPGRHNVANALAAMLAAEAAGVALADSAAALHDFQGVARRFDVIGERNDILVIDDFAHNPDKIAATLRTLHDFPGRLLILFQPHGFGPLRTLREGFVTCFVDHLDKDDRLFIPEPVYYGGTVDRSVSSGDLAGDICARGPQAEALPDRDACAARIVDLARPGDRIVIMGARDDTLPAFAKSLLEAL